MPPHLLVRAGLVATAVVSLAAAAQVVAPQPAVATPAACSEAGIGLASLGGPNFYIDSGATPAFNSSYTGFRITNSTGAAMSDLWVRLSDFSGGKLGLAIGQTPAEQIAALADTQSKPLFWYLTASGTSTAQQNFAVTVYRHNPDLPNATTVCTSTSGFNQVVGTLDASANKITGISVSGGAPVLGSTFTVTVTGNTGTMGSGPQDGSDPYSLWMSPAVTANWPPSAFRLEATNLNISPDGTAAAVDYPDTLRVANLGAGARAYSASYTFRAIGFTSAPTTVQPVQEIASGTQVKHTGQYTVALPTIAPPVNTSYVQLAGAPARLDAGGGQVDFTGTVNGSTGATLDSFTVTPPAGTTFVSGSAAFAGAAIADPVATSSSALVFSGPFTLPAASTPLTFALELPATPGDLETSFVAGLGTAVLGSDPNDTTGTHPATATVNVDTPPQAWDFARSVPQTQPTLVDVLTHATDADGDSLAVTAVSPATYGSVELADGSVTYVPDGEYLGPDTFTYTVDDGRGGTAQATVTVNVQSLAAQAITFPAIDDVTVGEPAQADAVADSGLPVVYSSAGTQVCTVDASGAVTTLAAGVCTIAADQPGDTSYAPAEQVSRSFTVRPVAERLPQTITATTPGDTGVLDPGSLTLDATADSGLPVNFASSTPEVCTVDPETGEVSLVSAGDCTITVSQDGDAGYLPAEPVDVTFAVTPAPQVVSFTAPEQMLTGPQSYSLAATSSAYLPVDYRVTDGASVCTLDGNDLTVTGVGSCTVEASAAGNAVYAAAPPVSRTITVVSPVADAVTLPPTTGVPIGQDIDVLANDPNGLELDGVGVAGHGTVAVSGSHVVYTPDIRFRGVDQFSYEVTDGTGRTASAVVTVTVPNAAPTAADAALRQLAGTAAHVRIHAADLNGDSLTLAVVRHPSDVAVSVTGLTITVRPAAAVSGRITITVAVHDGAGGTARAQVVDTVRPQPVAGAHRSISSRGTRLSWTAAPTVGATYHVRVAGHLVCETRNLGCRISRLLGPAISVTVVVLGSDDTRSAPTTVRAVHGDHVLVATVYFASGSWRPGATQRARLDRLAHRLTRNGFTGVHLSGYTDSIGSPAYNLHLSHQRTETVAQILYRQAGLASRQAWYGEKDPVVDEAAAARNRRVEILVS